MTRNKTIALNAFASYARTVYSVALGLFAGRWTLMALGQTDYGLMGVVGGLTVFITFINGLMAGSVGRFYAFAVGRASVSERNDGIDECRQWFNTALLLHTVFPILAIAIGYPAGIWAVEHYLVIPPDRIAACTWVWRFVCFSCFVGMVNVPFQAMYAAKQEIAELTIYSFATSTLNVCFLYYMVTHPGVWLTRFMAWTCFLSVAPQLIICVRAVIKYPECRFVPRYLWDARRVRDVAAYAGGRLICGLSQTFFSQGTAILVNKMLGPARNATMGIGNTVSGHCLHFSAAFTTAFSPAITNAAGARDYDRMRKLIYATCAISGASILMFSIPLCLEIDEVLLLWLKNPPVSSSVICVMMLLSAVCNCVSDGLWMGVFAMGRIAAYQTWESVVWFAVVPFAYVMIRAGFGIAGVGLTIFLARFVAILVKLHFASKCCDLPIRGWCGRVLWPLTISGGLAALVGTLPGMLLPPSFLRVFLTTIVAEAVFLPLTWQLALPEQTKLKIKNRLLSKFGRGNA